MKLPAYPTHRPSGVEWLGNVPEHWGVKRGRFCMDVNPSSSRLRTLRPDDEVSFVPMEAVGEYGGIDVKQTCTISDVGSGYTQFNDGDVVVAKITPCFENGKGALATGLANGAAFGTTELHVLRAAPTLDRRFLFYFTISRLFRSTGEGEMYGAGGQKRVPPQFCKNIRVPLPPPDDQRAIADFLDRGTAKIDTLVSKKRTLIERLKEKRTALISRTVTRGLPPDAARAAGFDSPPKLKPSGVDWLGEIPEHWEVTRLKHVVTAIEQGWSPDCDNAPAALDEWGVLKAGCCNGGKFVPEENKALPTDLDAPPRLEIQPGDILMSRASGSEDLVGSAALVPEGTRPRLLLSDKTYRLRYDVRRIVPALLARLLQSPLGRV